MRAMRSNCGPRKIAQRGAVLALSLLLLLALTLLALGASEAGRSQQRTAASLQKRDEAFELAEAALRSAERAVATSPTLCAIDRCRIYTDSEIGDPQSKSPAWWKQYGWPYRDMERTDEKSTDSMAWSIIQRMEVVPDSLAGSFTGPAPARIYYRVTAAAVVESGGSRVMLQSVVVRRTE